MHMMSQPRHDFIIHVLLRQIMVLRGRESKPENEQKCFPLLLLSASVQSGLLSGFGLECQEGVFQSTTHHETSTTAASGNLQVKE